jgi:hypothetical protein
LAGKPRNLGAVKTKTEYLAKRKEAQASVTKLACHRRFLPCAGTRKIILCECFLHLPWAL